MARDCRAEGTRAFKALALLLTGGAFLLAPLACGFSNEAGSPDAPIPPLDGAPSGDLGHDGGVGSAPDASAQGGDGSVRDPIPGVDGGIPGGGPSAHWEARFPVPGIIDGVDHPSFARGSVGEAVAVDSAGRVYVGGSRFGVAEQTQIRGIASWDGTQWKALGTGIQGESVVHSIATIGEDVYVAGEFVTAGGVGANGIARWSPSRGSWLSMGSGLRSANGVGVGRALAVLNGKLILGGSFDQVSGVAAQNIASYDPGTQTWSALNTGVNGAVTAISVQAGTVYVGGSFSRAGGTAASGIALWNGTTWSNIPGRDDGSRPQGIVGAVAGRGNTWLIAERSGGAGTITVVRGTRNSLSVSVRSFAPLFTAAPLGQDFLIAGAGGIYRWTGDNTLTQVVSGIEGFDENGAARLAPVRGIAADGRGGFYLTGEIAQANGAPTRAVAYFDGQRIRGLCTPNSQGIGFALAGQSIALNSADAPVEALAAAGDAIYAGGAFGQAGCSEASRVARWNGNDWTPLGDGMNDTVRALAATGNMLYAGGSFTQAGAVAAARVAAWNGAAWSALGAGMDDEVSALALSGSTLIAGGAFRSAGAAGTSFLAVWRGASWASLGGVPDAPVRALATDGDRIFVGGEFTTVGGTAASHVAVFDGNTWAALGAGLNGPVHGIIAKGMDVYVEGEFTQAGETAVMGLAHWDGERWQAMGSERPASRALGFIGDTPFALLSRSGIQLAAWDGTSWSSLGDPITAPVPASPSLVRAAVVTPGGIQVGGRFSWAGDPVTGQGLYMSHIGRLVLP